MPELTHQKARALLQAAADQGLSAQDKRALDAHLAICAECSDYADGLTKMEVRLRRVMREKWNPQHPNLELQTILDPSRTKRIFYNFINQSHAMGRVTIAVALLLGYVLFANLFGFRLPISEDKTPTAVPTPNELASDFNLSPTPSAQWTTTDPPAQSCETIVYAVQTADTLESIARQYGISKNAIIEQNKLLSENISPAMELLIPLCEVTPYYSVTMPNNTVTITPLNGTILPLQPE
jgi:LysM repeat protein